MAKINIVISNQEVENKDFNLEGNGGVGATSGSISDNNGQTAVVAKSVAAHALAQQGLSVIKTTFNIAKSNYGNFTGDYLGQAKIDHAFEVANTLIGAASSIGMGLMVGGPAGAVVAGVGLLVNFGLQEAQAHIAEELQNSKANQVASFNRARIGTILTNGGR